MIRIIPWLLKAEIKNGEVANRSIDFERYTEKLGFCPHGNPEFYGRHLALLPTGELVNVSTADMDADWGSGRIVDTPSPKS